MAGTIRRNGDNSDRELKRAQITSARRAAQRDRAESRFYDDKAIRARKARG